MRLVASVLALTLFAPFVRADDAAPPAAADETAPRPAAEAPRTRVPLRVVRVMPESRQALLFDRSRATHVLAEVGGKIDGYSVDEIDDDEVILSRDGAQFVLAAPAHLHERAAAPPRPAPRSSDSAGPVDPYADGEVRGVPDAGHAPTSPSTSAPSGAAPSSPAAPSSSLEAGAGGVRVAQAPSGASPARPIEPGSDGVRVAQAPMEPEPAPSAARTPGPAPSDVRVAEAPDASSRAVAPGPAPSVAAAAPAAAPAPIGPAPAASAAPWPSAAPSSPPIAAWAGAPDATPPASVRSSPGTSAPGARSLNAAMPDRPTRDPRPTPARAPHRPSASTQTDDALALADIMSADRSPRSPRGPAAAELPAGPPPPVATGRATSEIRTATPAPGDAIVISRGEVDRALADFAKLTAAIHASFSDTGVRVDGVGDGSIFERAGLKPGDTITSIDGTRLRSLDDAANLYARASTARSLTVHLVRDGQPLTLRVAIR